MISNSEHIVFDLDDTIYKEIDYMKSAYNHITRMILKSLGQDFTCLINDCLKQRSSLYDEMIKVKPDLDLSLSKYLHLYRYHEPNINLSKRTKELFKELDLRSCNYSIITDGRSITQRNKIESLKLTNKVQSIVISEETGFEKPDENNFIIIQNTYKNSDFIYVGDNTNKDFIAPNKLGWRTICLLDNGMNIHKQSFDLPEDCLPQEKISELSELLLD